MFVSSSLDQNRIGFGGGKQSFEKKLLEIQNENEVLFLNIRGPDLNGLLTVFNSVIFAQRRPQVIQHSSFKSLSRVY